MIYQQEAREINEYYDRFKKSKIVYSKEVSQSIGLVQKDTTVRIRDKIVKGALISSTMENIIVIVSLNDSLKQLIFDEKGMLQVQLKFINQDDGRSLLFPLHTKYLNMHNQGLTGENLYFISMDIRRKIPNDLIRILGNHHVSQLQKLKSKKTKVECILLNGTEKTDSIALKVTKENLELNVDAVESPAIFQKVIVILKVLKTGDVLEIIGKVSNIEDLPLDRCKVTVSYSMDDQSPRFGYSIHVLRNIINK